MSKTETVKFRCDLVQKQRWQDEADRRGVALSAMAELALDQFCGVRPAAAIPALGKRSYEPDWRATKKPKVKS